jgi:hypothetical protein
MIKDKLGGENLGARSIIGRLHLGNLGFLDYGN